MIVDCAHYVDGSRQSDRPISLDEAAMQCQQGGFVWLGMFEPSGEELTISNRSKPPSSPARSHRPNGSMICAARPRASIAPSTRYSPSSLASSAASMRRSSGHTCATCTTTCFSSARESPPIRTSSPPSCKRTWPSSPVNKPGVSVRQNSTTEQLTILATVFLPLTFTTGFFGQSFAWLVDNITGFTRFAVFGIGGLLVPSALRWAWMRRNQRAVAAAETPARAKQAAANRFGAAGSAPQSSPVWEGH